MYVCSFSIAVDLVFKLPQQDALQELILRPQKDRDFSPLYSGLNLLVKEFPANALLCEVFPFFPHLIFPWPDMTPYTSRSITVISRPVVP